MPISEHDCVIHLKVVYAYKREKQRKKVEMKVGMSSKQRKEKFDAWLEICVNFLCRRSFVIRSMRYRSEAIYKNMRIGRSTNIMYNLHKNVTLSLLFKGDREFSRALLQFRLSFTSLSCSTVDGKFTFAWLRRDNGNRFALVILWGDSSQTAAHTHTVSDKMVVPLQIILIDKHRQTSIVKDYCNIKWQ